MDFMAWLVLTQSNSYTSSFGMGHNFGMISQRYLSVAMGTELVQAIIWSAYA